MDKKRGLLLSFFCLLTVSDAYSFRFENTPEQCGTVTISVTGSDGHPPYRLGIIPWGGSPLQGGQLEVRRILDLQFNDSQRISFTLPYPKNSQFVALVSDNNASDSGFGSGGVTVPVSITGGSDDSCLPKSEVQPGFVFGTVPIGVITTCQSSLLTWNDTDIQGDAKFWGLIPGGQTFIVSGSKTQDQGKSAISWTPQVTTGTGILIVAGDNRGFGSGGSLQDFVQPGNGTTSCLSGSSPHSTPGSPAGGSYPTDSSGDRTKGDGSGNGNNAGAIAGGVIGGVAGIAIIGIVLFLLLRRSRSKKRGVVLPVDLLDGREGEPLEPDVPQQYIPEPYHVPPSAPTEMSETSRLDALSSLGARDRRVSGLSLTTQTRNSMDDTSTFPGRSVAATSQKSSAGPPTLRAVNIIQHEDAGPSEGPVQEEETVELPPAYTNLRK